MIISVYSPELKKYGGIDDQTKKIVIPFEYSDIEIQADGLVVTSENGDCGCYTLDGKIIYSPCKITNIIFLKDDLLLFTIPEENTVAITTFSGKPLLSMKFEAILFFCGINFLAIEYSISRDILDLLVENFFYTIGASVSARICVCSNGLWGVFDCYEQKLIVPCSFVRAIHYKDNSIILYDAQGNKTKV